MRIFITGANGQLARTIADLYPKKDMFLASKDSLDITNAKEVLKQIKEFNPDFIFHFASMTRGDDCALHPEKAEKINVKGTKNVVDAALATDASLLFVSTNEVFDGKKKKPYVEDDTPNPITVVGSTKHQAEELIRKNIEKSFIIRTSWLYSKWNSNFIHAVVTKAKNEKKISLVKDEVGSPTYSLDLAKAIKKLLVKKEYGTYHLSNAGIASRLDFAKKAFEIMQLNDVDITAVSLSDFQRISKPPLFTPLENTKAKKLGIDLPDWNDSLVSFLKSYYA